MRTTFTSSSRPTRTVQVLSVSTLLLLSSTCYFLQLNSNSNSNSNSNNHGQGQGHGHGHGAHMNIIQPILIPIRYATAFTMQPPPTSSRTRTLYKSYEYGYGHGHNNFNYHFKKSKSTTSTTKLNDLSEWRDQFFDVPEKVTQFLETNQLLTNNSNNANDSSSNSNSSNNNNNNNNNNNEPLREICVLPFPLDDVLLQGETKELCLYEDRFHQLFEDSTTNHNSVVAMGLLAPPAGILQNMPLCEIENYRVMKGQTAFGTDFSILVTIRVVGRASLMYIQDEDDDDDDDDNYYDGDEEEFGSGGMGMGTGMGMGMGMGIQYLKGWCMETSDNFDTLSESGKNVVEYGNTIADQLEDMVAKVQQMEDRLSIWGGGDSISSSSMDSINSVLDGDGNGNGNAGLNKNRDSLTDAQMKRRILEAELVSKCTSFFLLFTSLYFFFMCL